MDSKLRFDHHVEHIVNKSYRMLGFMSRITKEFKNIQCIKMLYNSLVRSTLEYCTTVWNPHHVTRIDQIERVQKKFTRHVWFKLRNTYSSYITRLKKLNMITLETRRIYFDLCSLHAIVNDGILLNIHLNITQRNNRNKLMFHPPRKRTDFGRFRQPTIRLQFLYNNRVKNQTIIFESKKKFKTNLKKEIFK